MRSQVARNISSSQLPRNMRRLLLVDVLEPEEIGGRIKLARERAGLRQEDLADLINVSTRTVQNYEAGDTKQYAQLALIARATNVAVEWLLHGDSLEPGEGDARLERILARFAGLEQTQRETRELLAELLRIVRGDPEEPRAEQR